MGPQKDVLCPRIRPGQHGPQVPRRIPAGGEPRLPEQLFRCLQSLKEFRTVQPAGIGPVRIFAKMADGFQDIHNFSHEKDLLHVHFFHYNHKMGK